MSWTANLLGVDASGITTTATVEFTNDQTAEVQTKAFSQANIDADAIKTFSEDIIRQLDLRDATVAAFQPINDTIAASGKILIAQTDQAVVLDIPAVVIA